MIFIIPKFCGARSAHKLLRNCTACFGLAASLRKTGTPLFSLSEKHTKGKKVKNKNLTA